MGKYLFCCIICIALKFNLIAQTAEPSATVDKNILQIELESLYTIQNEGSEITNSWSIPSTLFRYGLLNGFELQLNAPIIKEKLWENDHLIHSINKFDDIQFGFSINLWKEKKLMPETSIMFRAILPTDTKFNLAEFGEIVSLNFSNKISKNLSLNFNIGHVIETNNASSCFYIVNLSYQTSPKLHLFLENFGDLHNNELMSHNINLGGGYNLSDNIILDFSASKGLNTNIFYTGGVLTWIINTKKN